MSEATAIKTDHETIEEIEADPNWRFFLYNSSDEPNTTEEVVYIPVEDNGCDSIRFLCDLDDEAERCTPWQRVSGLVELDSAECLILYQSGLPHDHTTDIERMELDSYD